MLIPFIPTLNNFFLSLTHHTWIGLASTNNRIKLYKSQPEIFGVTAQRTDTTWTKYQTIEFKLNFAWLD